MPPPFTLPQTAAVRTNQPKSPVRATGVAPSSAPSASSAGEAPAKKAKVTTEEPPTKAKEAKAAKEMPSWAHIGPFEAWRWKSTLDEYGCDSVSQRELFALAQHSAEGASAAAACVSKLLKSTSDGREIRNYSAYLHQIVKTECHAVWKQ